MLNTNINYTLLILSFFIYNLCLIHNSKLVTCESIKRPHIIFILADDLVSKTCIKLIFVILFLFFYFSFCITIFLLHFLQHAHFNIL